MDPYLTVLLLSEVGGEIISRLMPSRNSPYEQSVKQGMGYGQRLMPEIYSEAMGQPSMATRNTMRNLGEEVNRAQQSYAASAQRSAPSMTGLTTPVREQQNRLQAAKIRGYGDILGQAQTAAQSEIMNIYGTATTEQRAIEMQNQQAHSDLMSGIAGLVGDYKGMQADAEFKRQMQPYLKSVYSMLLKIFGGQLPSSSAGNAMQYGGWSPSEDLNLV